MKKVGKTLNFFLKLQSCIASKLQSFIVEAYSNVFLYGMFLMFFAGDALLCAFTIIMRIIAPKPLRFSVIAL